MLHADEVITKVFREKLRGYDQGEVDEFLDQVADALTAGERRVTELAAELAEQQEAAFEAAEAETLLKRTLLAAQRTADDTVKRAREEAAALVANAHAEVESVHSDARREAAQIVDDATRQATEMVAAMRRQIHAEQEASRATLADVERIAATMQRLREDFRVDARAALETRLATLDGAELVPPPSPEALELSAQARALTETLPATPTGAVAGTDPEPPQEPAREPDPPSGDPAPTEPGAPDRDLTGELAAVPPTARRRGGRRAAAADDGSATGQAPTAEPVRAGRPGADAPSDRWGGWFGDDT